MENRLNNVSDEEIINYIEQLLRESSGLNRERYRETPNNQRSYYSNYRHNNYTNNNEMNNRLYNLMTEYNTNIREYNGNMRVCLNLLSRINNNENTNTQYNQRNYRYNTPSNEYEETNNINMNNQRAIDRNIWSNILFPSYSRTNFRTRGRTRDNDDIFSNLFNDVIITPTETQFLSATQLIQYSSNVEYTNTSCPITLEEFQNDQQVCQIRYCGHIFYEDALRNWFRRNVRCPICRYDIRNYVNFSNETNETNTNTDENNNDEDNNNDENPTIDLSNNETNYFRGNVTNSITNTLIRGLTNGLTSIINEYVNNANDTSYNATRTFEIPIVLYRDVSGNQYDYNDVLSDIE
jgi:hypothetical protein